MAATTHIEVVGSESRAAGQLRYLVDRVRQANDDLRQLVQVCQQANLDTGGLAALLGLSADNAGAVLGILNGAKAELDADPFFNQLLSRLG